MAQVKASRLNLLLATSDTTLFELLTGSLHLLWAAHVLVTMVLYHTGAVDFARVPGASSHFLYANLSVWGWIALRVIVGVGVCAFALTPRMMGRFVMSIIDATLWGAMGTLFIMAMPSSPASTFFFAMSLVSFHVTYRLCVAVLIRRESQNVTR